MHAKPGWLPVQRGFTWNLAARQTSRVVQPIHVEPAPVSERYGPIRTIRRVPAKRAHTWRFVVAAPPREVFAVMEQMIGTPPYRFEVVGDDAARIVEYQRNSLVGTLAARRRHRPVPRSPAAAGAQPALGDLHGTVGGRRDDRRARGQQGARRAAAGAPAHRRAQPRRRRPPHHLSPPRHPARAGDAGGLMGGDALPALLSAAPRRPARRGDLHRHPHGGGRRRHAGVPQGAAQRRHRGLRRARPGRRRARDRRPGRRGWKRPVTSENREAAEPARHGFRRCASKRRVPRRRQASLWCADWRPRYLVSAPAISPPLRRGSAEYYRNNRSWAGPSFSQSAPAPVRVRRWKCGR